VCSSDLARRLAAARKRRRVGGRRRRRLNGVRPDLLFDPQRKDAGSSAAGDAGSGPPWGLIGFAGLVVAGGLAALVLYLRRERRLGSLSPLDRAVFDLELALRRAGRPLTTGTTLRQLEHRMGASEDATAYLRALSASRYGGTTKLPTAADRRAMRRALAQGLGWAGRLRALWALPPRR